ncbi:hypothetical protein CN514_15600 [Bacillus sp. AFS001701]|nr:hypothetical protein CN514_15600 [Bacillus sp. AFS001701]
MGLTKKALILWSFFYFQSNIFQKQLFMLLKTSISAILVFDFKQKIFKFSEIYLDLGFFTGSFFI